MIQSKSFSNKRKLFNPKASHIKRKLFNPKASQIKEKYSIQKLPI
jgi:hypothetical protein